MIRARETGLATCTAFPSNRIACDAKKSGLFPDPTPRSQIRDGSEGDPGDERLHELVGGRSIDESIIAREGQSELVLDFDRVLVESHWCVLDPIDAHNSRFGVVDDRRSEYAVFAVCPRVRHGKSPVSKVCRIEVPGC